MRLLLDTHVFLWWNTDDPHLPKGFRAAIVAADNEVFVSAATVWEIAIKRSMGKLAFEGSPTEFLAKDRFLPLAITPEHAEQAGLLPPLHRDPFDRMLIAQARLEGLMLATVDEQIRLYDVPCLG